MADIQNQLRAGDLEELPPPLAKPLPFVVNKLQENHSVLAISSNARLRVTMGAFLQLTDVSVTPLEAAAGSDSRGRRLPLVQGACMSEAQGLVT